MKPILVSCLIISLCCGESVAGGKEILVNVHNPSSRARSHETISVPLNELRQLLPRFEADKLVVVATSGGVELVSQVLEDELLFQSGFSPRETKQFVISVSDRKRRYQSLVAGRFVLPREDYAWENDRVAFRMYGPALAKDVNNGIDVWTKRVRHLVVDKWYRESAESGKDMYHEDRGEGADFYTVGKSLGAGGSGIWLEGKLHQPGVFSSYNTTADGPLRVAFELTYDRWDIGGMQFKEIRRISLDAGHYLNRIEVSFSGLPATDGVTIACGLAKRKDVEVRRSEHHCTLSWWGQTNSDTTNGFLGTGVVAARPRCIAFAEDSSQFVMLATAAAGISFVYYAGAGWSRHSPFTSADDWNKYLEEFAENLNVPLRISLKLK